MRLSSAGWGLSGVAAGGGVEIGRGGLAPSGAYNPSMMISTSRWLDSGRGTDRVLGFAAERAVDRGDVFPGEVSLRGARALSSLYEVVQQFGQAGRLRRGGERDPQLALDA